MLLGERPLMSLLSGEFDREKLCDNRSDDESGELIDVTGLANSLQNCKFDC